ncbi:MAG TPA: WXG100 family type VII secretion target [Ktedonobacteraceae bacterium]|jgi:WXG100 family type VII secretion target|nr:WXG100 family type VII secretion target [Ktedonobacteraceae bacterium]
MAGNENMAANYGDMERAVSQFNARYAEFEQALTQITGAIEQLGATWVGQGFNSFQAAMTNWHSQATTLNQTLDEISKDVNRSSTSYQEHDTNIAQGFNRYG